MSDDLIRRSDVYKAVDDWLAGRVPNLNIKDIPSADRPSIDIVRCAECKWGKPYSDKQLECDALGLGGLKFPDDFCSYGERKESE